jgi:hypothetical protein
MWDKFKWFIEDDTIYYSAVIILASLLSFGLGRLSVVPNVELSSVSGVTQQSSALISQNLPQIAQDMATTSTTTEAEILYVGSKNSNKYHLPWCSGAQRIAEANKVYFKSKAEAEAAGYTPAANCKGI